MAHHQQINHERTLAAQGLSSGSSHGFTSSSATGDDELASDVDEPPDQSIQFAKMSTPTASSSNMKIGDNYITPPHLLQDRKESLLTQALLSSPELNPMSDTEAPVLTSDGGMTSPARTTTPSPPLPIAHTGLAAVDSRGGQEHKTSHAYDPVHLAPAMNGEFSREINVEAGLGRKRCISFACGRRSAPQESSENPSKAQGKTDVVAKAADPPKRPCMLKFACPMKPPYANTGKVEKRGKSPSQAKQVPSSLEVNSVNRVPEPSVRTYRDSCSMIQSGPYPDVSQPPAVMQSRKGRVFNRIDFQKSEATRFYEFACHFGTADEWTNEQTAYRQKITVNDTLRKENAIRKLAEEAEEEALYDEDEDGSIADDDKDEDLSDIDEDGKSDDGNETDDEEGFADSDNESDDGSNYRFWTPGLTTAATSTDHLEHIRPIAYTTASNSSLESTMNTKDEATQFLNNFHAGSPSVRPRTPNLPDSSDFVVGTVDEDRPLEEAYWSCLEERRRSKLKLIPQDIDPSFPASEPEADNHSGEGDVEEYDSYLDDQPKWVTRRLETSEDIELFSSKKRSALSKAGTPSKLLPKRTLSPTPKCLQSPPTMRAPAHRSPPPRRLFGHNTHRLRSPPPMHRKLTSPPSSRQPSMDGSSSRNGVEIDLPHLAQRPNLTHTTSLPRTPNPFWGQHHRSRFQSTGTPSTGTSPKDLSRKRPDAHSRGPIDIVQGLETKRQRRKDKFWRQHCRTAGKEKHRRCQPGKGAERMKELGLEMADRFRGYGQKAQLILSV